jgi:hypothetical protein
MKSPHLLLAASNCRKMLENLRGVLDANACVAIEQEINRNVVGLFQLGEDHVRFAKAANRIDWRQKISRLYYGAYNVRRAVQLHTDGGYKTDVSDHKNINEFPLQFPNSSTYKVQLVTLRDDRNLSDYSHDVSEADLILSVSDAEKLVTAFIADARRFLNSRGLTL